MVDRHNLWIGWQFMMYVMTFDEWMGFMVEEMDASVEKKFPCVLRVGHLQVVVYCSNEPSKKILDSITPTLILLFNNIVQPFEAMALDLIRRYEGSTFLVIGHSLKLLKWALKNHKGEAYVAALTVSGVDPKFTPTELFTAYLGRKLEKLGRAKCARLVIVDYSSTGRSLLALKRDIMTGFELKNVVSVAYKVGVKALPVIPEFSEYSIDEVVTLPGNVSELVDSQELKSKIGRNKPKFSYEAWPEKLQDKYGRSSYNERDSVNYASQKFSYQEYSSFKEICAGRDIYDLSESFVRSVIGAIGKYKEEELYCPEDYSVDSEDSSM